MNDKIQVGIIGGAGYTGGELLRILINHPLVNVSFVQSNSQAGKPVWATHTDLLGDTDLLFSGPADAEDDELDLDVLFLCSGHGASATFMAEHEISDDVAIIDLSTDFRDETERLRVRPARTQPRTYCRSYPHCQPRLLCHQPFNLRCCRWPKPGCSPPTCR